jgi:hypothetical protein
MEREKKIKRDWSMVSTKLAQCGLPEVRDLRRFSHPKGRDFHGDYRGFTSYLKRDLSCNKVNGAIWRGVECGK